MKGILSPMLGACVCACAFGAHAAPDAVAQAPAAAPAQQQPQQQQARAEPTFDIDAFDVDGNTVLDQESIETAVYPFMGPQRHRQDVAGAVAALEKAYHDKGFQTVVVQVPQQDARTGIVKLHVAEIPVGRLRVVGANYTLPSRIKEAIPSLAAGTVPNLAKAQEELAEVNRLPETQVSTVERKGKEPGTVDIDLKVKDQLPLHASATVNNDHSQNTTPLRTVASVSYTDLFQLGHTISGTAILAPENLKESEVLSGAYTAPIWGTPWTILMSGYSSNSNVEALSGTGVLGRGYNISLAGQLQLPPAGDFNQNMSFGIDFKHSLQSIVVNGAMTEVGIDYWPLNASYSVSRVSNRATLGATAAITLGLRGLGSDVGEFLENRAFARANFTKFNLDASYLRNLPWDLQLATHFTAQLTDQPLLPNEEFAAGGLSSLRGYLQSEALGDEGFSADFTLSSPSLAPFASSLIGKGILDDWRFYVFSDSAVAWVLDSLPEQRSVFQLSSIGFGTQMNLLSHFTGNVLVGMPLRYGPATKAWHPTFEFSASTEF